MKPRAHTLFCSIALFLWTSPSPPAIAQDAAPADRNAVNTAARPGDMMADSPVTFPKQGALPSKFPPDVKEQSEPAEKEYYIFNSPCRSLAQIAAVQEAMPAGQFTPPPSDWTHLRRTRRLLTEGGELRLLAVGDSIVNDTMRSGWVALLQDAYPKARIQATVYVRGGGGCQHYKQEGRVAKNILPRKPDLVLIGGISQSDIASIREVIHQLRAGLPEVEILLATGTFGTADPRDASALARAPHSGTGAYGLALRALALEERCAYLDMTTPWAEYIRSTGQHPHRFYRDVVHANEFGEQILAKIMMSFWTAPDPGQPSTLSNRPPAQTPLEWLRQQTLPRFKPGHTLPRLGQMHCVNPPVEFRAELARHWGFAVRLNRPKGEKELLRLCAENPAVYQPAAMIGNLANLESDRSRKWPEGTFLRKADGTWAGGRPLFSPEMPDAAWRMVIDEAIRQIDGQRGNLPAEAVVTVEDWTEYGLAVPIHMAEHGAMDPKVLAAKGNRSWQEYTSERKAYYDGQMWAEIKRRYPNAFHTAYTYSGFIGKPSGDWAWEYRHLKAVTDLPSPECYYNYYNTGFVGTKDMLTLRLLWRHVEIQEGSPHYFGWLCAGYQRNIATYQGDAAQGLYADLPRWMGYLKMSYLAGMLGGITTGEFACEIRYEPFDPALPPRWLDQMPVLAHAHALFTWIEPVLRQSQLLPGPKSHAWNQDCPAYELPTGHPHARVLVRKVRDANRWLVGAWAADGAERLVSVSVPGLGEHRITARPEATLHLVDREGDKVTVHWLDETGMTPSLTASQLERHWVLSGGGDPP